MATAYGLTARVLPAINFKVQEFSRANDFNMVSLICTGGIYPSEAAQIFQIRSIESLQCVANSPRFPNVNVVMQVLAEKVSEFVTGLKTSHPQGQSALFTISVLMSGYNKATGNRQILIEQSNDFIGSFNFSEARPASIYQGL